MQSVPTIERAAEFPHGLLITLLASNRSIYSNAILVYAVEGTLRNGTNQTLEVSQGTVTVRDENHEILARHDVNVIPMNVPARTEIEAHLDFLIDATNFPNPLRARITATDMHGKRYTAICSVANPFSAA